MNKIIKYRVAYGQSLRDLEEKVNKLIQKGYIPYGELQFATTPESMCGECSPRLYIQTMVIYENDKE